MADQAAAVAEQSIKIRTRGRSLVWTVAPIVALVGIDLTFSVLSFLVAYVLRQQAPAFIWSSGSVFPVAVARDFQPYFTLLLFVPVVKLICFTGTDCTNCEVSSRFPTTSLGSSRLRRSL